MAAHGHSRIRIWTGATLAILSFSLLFVAVYSLLMSMLLGIDFIPVVVLIIASTSFILLIATHLSLKSKIIYWFIPAQAFAFAAALAGVATVLAIALGNWSHLFRFDGLMGILSLAVGLAISLSANRLLARYSPLNA